MGGGTTAILSSPPPNQSPQATRAMGMGAAAGAGAMAAGIAPAHTSVQPQFQDEYEPAAGTGQYRTGGASERSLPPPREAEEPKRNPTGPILVTLAGIAVIAVAIWLLVPWGDEDDDPTADGSATPTATTAETSAEAVEETTQEQEDDSDNDGGNQEDDQDDEETSSSPEVEVLEVPDVTGDLVTDAKSEIENLGFTNVSTQVQSDDGDGIPDDAEPCTVDSQTPTGDTGAPYNADTMITLVFWDDGSGCGT
jgi:hypothetical protein